VCSDLANAVMILLMQHNYIHLQITGIGGQPQKLLYLNLIDNVIACITLLKPKPYENCCVLFSIG